MSDIDEWKVVAQNPNYVINLQGIVRHKDRKKTLKHFISEYGYPSVRLYSGNNGKFQRARVHRLLMIAYNPNKDLSLSVCHNDGNKLNYELSNLRWATQAENNKDMIKHGTLARGVRHGRSKLTPELVKEIRQETELTQKDMARKYGVSRSNISMIRGGLQWKI